jgi:thioredoxin 1
MHIIESEEKFKELIELLPAVMAFFSMPSCNVCSVLKPKAEELISESFPEMEFIYIDSVLNPGIAGQHGVFTSPTIIIYFRGQEFIRNSRVIDLHKLGTDISRLYQLMFS